MKSILIADEIHSRLKKSALEKGDTITRLVEKAVDYSLIIEQSGGIRYSYETEEERKKAADAAYEEIKRLFFLKNPGAPLAPDSAVEFIREVFYGSKVSQRKRRA